MENKSLIPTEKIDRAMLIIRGHKVIMLIDPDGNPILVDQHV